MTSKKKFKTSWFYASLASEEKEVKTLLKTKVKKDISQRSIDFDEYAQQLEEQYETFDKEGYEVINVVPISMGQSEFSDGASQIVGFSITRGAVIVGKKKET